MALQPLPYYHSHDSGTMALQPRPWNHSHDPGTMALQPRPWNHSHDPGTMALQPWPWNHSHDPGTMVLQPDKTWLDHLCRICFNVSEFFQPGFSDGFFSFTVSSKNGINVRRLCMRSCHNIVTCSPLMRPSIILNYHTRPAHETNT